jgi:co-chaperonin GroES (HSP10)
MSSNYMLPNREDFIQSVETVTGRPDFTLKASGFRVLIAMPDYQKKTKGGIELPDDYVKREEMASPVGYVVELGPDAYKDEKRFPSGPRCQAGDFIIMRPYSGTRVILHGKEFRFINDDTVDGTVADPQNIERIA